MVHRGIAALIPARHAVQRKVKDHAHSLLCRAVLRPANRDSQASFFKGLKLEGPHVTQLSSWVDS